MVSRGALSARSSSRTGSRSTRSGSTSSRGDRRRAVDPRRSERAAAGPFGTTIAHGFLTLSLVVPLFEQALPPLEGYGLTVNYGLNRVRFTAPVPVGSRIRGRFAVEEVEEVAGGEQLHGRRDDRARGQEKPVCVAEALFRFYRSRP